MANDIKRPPFPKKPLPPAPRVRQATDKPEPEAGTNTFSSNTGGDRTYVSTMPERTHLTRTGIKMVPVLQVSSGADRGRILSLAQYQQITIGRGKKCELVVHDPSCSRMHSEIAVDLATGKATIKDLGSTNGTKVNGKAVGSEPFFLNDGDRIQLGDNTNLKYSLMAEQDAQTHMEVYYRATRDALTKASNRHQFEDALSRELSYQKRAGHGLGIIIFDVDHFKNINDSHGHPAGDEVLRTIGERVPTCVRNEDMFARLGGEEFGVLVRNDTAEGVSTLAERIRHAMEKEPAEYEKKRIPFTVSVGSTFIIGKSDADENINLFQIADQALYEAKNSGRNKAILKRAPTPIVKEKAKDKK